jgi:hypothetical protein
MINAKKIFGAQLILELHKDDILKREFDCGRIAKWASNFTFDHRDELKQNSFDKALDDIVQDIACSDAGPEFELTKGEIEKIAIDCINAP